MGKNTHIRLKAIDYVYRWEEVKGSYYDYVITAYSPNRLQHAALRTELFNKGWREIKTNTGVEVFEQNRHIIRIDKIW